MAEKGGPRDWSPRNVWIVFIDEPAGRKIWVFRRKSVAYHNAVGAMRGWLGHLRDEDADEIRDHIRKGEDEEALDLYTEVVSQDGIENMPYYSVDEHEVE